MEFDFFKSKESEGSGAKLTAHRNGRLGLSTKAIELLKIENWKWCAFARDKNRADSDVIYMMRMDSAGEYTFNVMKVGEYYNIKAKSLLDDLGVDYKNTKTTIIFDITPVDNNGTRIYRLKKRVTFKRNKKAE